MTERNFEARRFGDKHQARGLAEWCGDARVSETLIVPAALAADSPKRGASHGDWIIKAADGTIRIEQGGNQAGYCSDCGEPVWWHEDRLVTRSGRKWCFGKDEAHPGMSYHHALPGMPQWVARARDGETCRCLDRDGPHIHRIIPADPDARPEDAWDAALKYAVDAARATLARLDALPWTVEPSDRITYISALAALACTLMGLPADRWSDRLYGAINGECGKPGRFYPETAADAIAVALGPGDMHVSYPGFWRSALIAACPEHAPAGTEPEARFAAQRAWCQHRDADVPA